jgi:arabinofuranosyltransferase
MASLDEHLGTDSTQTHGPPESPLAKPRIDRLSWFVLAVPIVVTLVGAWSYRWVQEDAFIDFRIIGNLLAGNGPVFNVGERVEAYSDPLWLFLLATLHEVIPFVSLEWLAVVLGLLFTAGGVIFAGRAIQRLGAARGDDLVLPIGLLIFSVVAGVWEFSTSGLEMGMAFCWIGLSFWLLVRTEANRTSAMWCAFVVGLGALIRPELILMSIVFLVALGLVTAAPGWQGPTSTMRRYVIPLVVALCLPVPMRCGAWRISQ